jgi:hypothetical protein
MALIIMNVEKVGIRMRVDHARLNWKSMLHDDNKRDTVVLL